MKMTINYEGKKYFITVSEGNTKMSARSVSVPPVITCSHCSDCQKYCYAGAMQDFRDSCRKSWLHNAITLSHVPASVIVEALAPSYACSRFWRWDVAGDIWHDSYMEVINTLAREYPMTSVFCPTRQLERVSAYYGYDPAAVPQSLHFVRSHTPGGLDAFPLKVRRFWYKFPLSYVVPRDQMQKAHKEVWRKVPSSWVKECRGDCHKCGYSCFRPQVGYTVTLFPAHGKRAKLAPYPDIEGGAKHD